MARPWEGEGLRTDQDDPDAPYALILPRHRRGPLLLPTGEGIYFSSLPSLSAAGSNGYSTLGSGRSNWSQTSSGARVCRM